MNTTPLRIDTHQHIVPPVYAAWLAERGLNAGGRAIPEWSDASALDLMNRAGIGSAVLSVSTPGVHLGDDAQAREMARAVNEFSAGIAQRHPERLGYFATLTLPDVQGAIAEARHAFDQLGADGVVLLANVGGRYLGDPEWEPLMAELNTRSAVVFVHPSALPAAPVPGIAPFVADFLLDTTRAAINLARVGTFERYPQLRIILSHAGGFVPFAAERMARACSDSGEDTAQGLARLKRFHYDLALSSSPYALPSLLAFADPTRILYGSDWPFAPAARSLHFARLLDEYPLTPEQRHAIHRGNAEALVPRWRKG